MKISNLIALVVVLSGPVAFATPINITVDSSGALLNTIGVADKTQYGSNDNNPSSNLAFLNTEIGNWNGVPLTPTLPGPETLADNIENLNGDSYLALSGFDYVVFHFGAGRAGGKGGYWQAFYLDGTGGTFDIPDVGGEPVGGFSSARYFDATTSNVPDSASTLLLGALGLVGVAIARRRLGTA